MIETDTKIKTFKVVTPLVKTFSVSVFFFNECDCDSWNDWVKHCVLW